jgi:hypothetical protein
VLRREGARVPSSTELEELAFRHGRSKKRRNAIVALLSGGVPAAILSFSLPFNWQRWFLGFCLGLLWGNAFEYTYHRWLLHRPRSAFGKGHLEHHAKVGTTEEPEHVSLGKSPLHIFLLFAVNGILVIVLDVLLDLRIGAGIFVGWSLYLITAEEIHWRIHLGGWLPRGLRFARAYHMGHHDTPNAHYNVFLPLFDLLCGSTARLHPSPETVPNG